MNKYFFAAAMLAGTICSTTAEAQSLGIPTGQQGSMNYAANSALAQFISQELGMDVRVQSYGGAAQVLPLLDSGRMDITLVPAPDLGVAVGGRPPFEGRPQKNLRVLGTLGATYTGFMVREDSAMETLADIKGKTISYGFSASPFLKPHVDGILASGGLTIDDMERDNVASVTDGVDDLISGNTDIAYFSLTGGKSREADAQIGIRWLNLDNTPEANASLEKFVPMAYITEVTPGGATPGIDEPQNLMAFDYVLAAGVHMSDEAITQIVKLLHDNPESVRKLHGAFSQFTPEGLSKPYEGLEYHPAVVTYFQEHGASE